MPSLDLALGFAGRVHVGHADSVTASASSAPIPERASAFRTLRNRRRRGQARVQRAAARYVARLGYDARDGVTPRDPGADDRGCWSSRKWEDQLVSGDRFRCRCVQYRRSMRANPGQLSRDPALRSPCRGEGVRTFRAGPHRGRPSRRPYGRRRRSSRRNSHALGVRGSRLCVDSAAYRAHFARTPAA